MKKFVAFVITLMICGSLFAATYKSNVVDDFNEPTNEYVYLCESDESSFSGFIEVSGSRASFTFTEECITFQVTDNYRNGRPFMLKSSVTIKIKGMTTNEIVEINFVENDVMNSLVVIQNNSSYYTQIVNLFKANPSVKVSAIVENPLGSSYNWKAVSTFYGANLIFS